MQSPRTLLIIVNWNKAPVLEAMLTSLVASGPREYDAVLIDNASTDNSVAMVQEKFPWIHVIQNKENLGGTGGFNTGLRYALQHPNNYRYLWLLDNDVVVHPGAYAELLKPMLADERLGMVGSCILLMDAPDQVQECGGIMHWPTGSIHRGYEGPVSEMPNHLIEVDFSAACSVLVRTAAVREVGIWDENYFILWDDVEWGVRMKRAGWKVVATPVSRVQHESYDNRRGQSAALSTYLGVRNNLYFNTRFAPARNLFSNLYFHLRMVLGFADNYRANGREGDAAVIERGIDDFLAGQMGRPPGNLAALASQGSDVGQSAELPPATKLAVLCRDNPDTARELVNALSSNYKSATIDTILVSQKPEVLQANLPNARVVDATTFVGRLRLAAVCALQYDAVAAAVFMPEFFAERCAKFSLRFEPGNEAWRVRRRNFLQMLGTIARRVVLPIRIASIILRALPIRKLRIDYQTGHPIDKS